MEKIQPMIDLRKHFSIKNILKERKTPEYVLDTNLIPFPKLFFEVTNMVPIGYSHVEAHKAHPYMIDLGSRKLVKNIHSPV